MADLASLIRVVQSLRDPELRLGFLGQALAEEPVNERARLVNQICEESARGHTGARDVLLAVAMWLLREPEGKAAIELRQEAERKSLLGLKRLVSWPRESAAVSLSPPAVVPDYGAGRELTVGERRSLARRPSREAFDRLLNDPHPLVLRQLLDNPKLTEDDVARLAAKRPVRLEVFTGLSQKPRWLIRRRVRSVIVLNPGAPAFMAVPLLSLCSRTELRLVMQSTELTGYLRALSREYLELMPPLAEPVSLLQ